MKVITIDIGYREYQLIFPENFVKLTETKISYDLLLLLIKEAYEAGKNEKIMRVSKVKEEKGSSSGLFPRKSYSEVKVDFV